MLSTQRTTSSTTYGTFELPSRSNVQEKKEKPLTELATKVQAGVSKIAGVFGLGGSTLNHAYKN